MGQFPSLPRVTYECALTMLVAGAEAPRPGTIAL
jgi:hypothetical protein